MNKVESNLKTMLERLNPKHHAGEFVFCVIDDFRKINLRDIVLLFKEEEGYTVVIEKKIADQLKLEYSFIAGWISLGVYSSLNAVGLTATFSKALADHNISCNVVSAYYHDHIFVDKKDIVMSMEILNRISTPDERKLYD